MKKLIITSIFLSLLTINSQLNSESTNRFICHYSGEAGRSTYNAVPASDLASKRVSSILNIVGLHKNFSVKAADVDNASALVKGSNRYILYNPNFMQSVRNTAGFDWTSYSILAHEIGHHLNGHTLQPGGSRPSIELEADEFSGFVLQKMGASLKEAQTAIAIIGSENGSSTHPARSKKLEAIKKGWLKAREQE